MLCVWLVSCLQFFWMQSLPLELLWDVESTKLRAKLTSKRRDRDYDQCNVHTMSFDMKKCRNWKAVLYKKYVIKILRIEVRIACKKEIIFCCFDMKLWVSMETELCFILCCWIGLNIIRETRKILVCSGKELMRWNKEHRVANSCRSGADVLGQGSKMDEAWFFPTYPLHSLLPKLGLELWQQLIQNVEFQGV